MLHQPLSPSDEERYREKLAQWYPHEALQDRRLEELVSFLSSDRATTEVQQMMRTLFEFCLEQSRAAREISDHERAVGREDFLLSPSHPLMRQLIGEGQNRPADGDTMNSVVDHLRQTDLQRRLQELKALLPIRKSIVSE